jgi:hypothetical protein
MSTPPLSMDAMLEVLELKRKYGDLRKAADATGQNRNTLSARYQRAKNAVEAGLIEAPMIPVTGARPSVIPISQDESKIQEATREEIIAEILRVIEQDTTKVVTRNHFRNESRYAESAWISQFRHLGGSKTPGWRNAEPASAHRLGLHIAKHASVDRMRALNVEKSEFEGKFLRPSNNRWQSTLAASDFHGLHCDPFVRRVFIDTARRLQPSKIVLDGDMIDAAEFSKHTQDPRQFKVIEEIRWLHAFLAELRVVCPNAEIIFVAGNHEQRLLRHLSEQTPAMMVVLSDLHGFTVSKLLGLDKFEVNYIDRGDLTAWSERDMQAQLRKNYVMLFDKSLLFGHFPEMRNMGIPGASGHHHKHIVWPFYSPTYGSYEWHQMGCGHAREASYCAGERWSQGFLICHTDTLTKRTQFEYIDVSHDAAMVGGKFYQRDIQEPVLDLVA